MGECRATVQKAEEGVWDLALGQKTIQSSITGSKGAVQQCRGAGDSIRDRGEGRGQFGGARRREKG